MFIIEINIYFDAQTKGKTCEAVRTGRKIYMNMSDVQNGELGSHQGQTIIVNQPARQTNGMGTAGFVLALVAFFLCWVPFLNWILWILGLVLSAVGIFKQPKGLAIAGLVISLIGLIFIISIIGLIASLIGFAL